MKISAVFVLFFLSLNHLFAAYETGPIDPKNKLLPLFMRDNSKPSLEQELKEKTLKENNKAVSTLVEVMKNSKYPEKNQWHATFLLVRIMGSKSAPFISKFSDHPNWMMRLATLKALLILKEKSYANLYEKMLNDRALVVRQQALDNIVQLKIERSGEKVWKMIFDKENYIISKNGKAKRADIVGRAIRTLGDIKYQTARKHLVNMIKKKEYRDLVEEIDYSLSKMTGKQSPGNVEAKKKFWEREIASVSKHTL